MKAMPIRHYVAGISAGIVDNVPMLDLQYSEDSRAMVDLNCVMNEQGGIIELQGTGEAGPSRPGSSRSCWPLRPGQRPADPAGEKHIGGDSMKFVLASHNRKKLAEMQEILRELGVEVVLQSDVSLDLEPEENGTTFAENAAIKAMAVMQASGLPAIADDSGLCVDALNGAPGIYSARYGGVDSDQAAIACCWRISGVLGAPPISTPPSSAASPMGTGWTPPEIASAPLPMHPRGTTASAMTRCSSCRSCARPLPS